MNKYYSARTSADPAVIGVTNGVTQAEIFKSGFENNKLYEKILNFFNGEECWHKNDKEPNFQVELQSIKLLKNAKTTSFISYGPKLRNCPFLISDEVKLCFEDFNIQKHYLYSANLINKNRSSRFWLFHMPPLSYDVIDFNDSVFFSGSRFREKQHPINNQAEFIEFMSSNYLRPAKIVLNKKFDKSLDLFETRVGPMFVSERLRSELVNRKFSGLEFIPTFDGDPNQPMIEMKN